MKKINILDLLCDEYIEIYNREENNLKKCTNNIDKDIINYILPYLENNYNLLDLDFNFNFNSNNKIEQYKSIYLASNIILGVMELIKSMPTYFNYFKEKYSVKEAYDVICLRAIIGNILDIKQSLNNINENMSNSYKELLDKIYINIKGVVI